MPKVVKRSATGRDLPVSAAILLVTLLYGVLVNDIGSIIPRNKLQW